MHPLLIISCLAAGLALALASGWWRLALKPLRIRRSDMTIERLGFAVREPSHVERVNGILESFAGGFNSMLTAPGRTAWQDYRDALPEVYRPFAHEGAAMGHTPRHLMRYRPEIFECQIVEAHSAYGYLAYVGLGFWSGMRGHDPARVTRIVEDLDPLHGALCYDGYGFKYGFFDYLKHGPHCFDRFEDLNAYGRNVAYQGVGRSFWFLFMDDTATLMDHIDRQEEYAPDVASGLGLASVFVFPDRLETAIHLGRQMPGPWRDAFHLGMCFGLKARSLNDPATFQTNVARMDGAVQDAIHASIEACDEAEKRVRASDEPDGYRRWREEVTQWMADHVVYPISGRAGSPAVMASTEPAMT